MQISGLSKTTLLDYPNHIAATLFTSGCNFRCPFCHNSSLVLPNNLVSSISKDSVLDFLSKRKNILEGVCISGGEPTLQPDLLSFLYKIKKMGYLIKLDTNGYQPAVLKELIDHNIIDYFAMDIKTSPDQYSSVVGLVPFDMTNIQQSITCIMSCGVPYEFRTTVVKELHTLEIMLHIGDWIQGCQAYYLQNFQDSDQVLTTGFHSHHKSTLNSFILALQDKIPNVSLRGIY